MDGKLDPKNCEIIQVVVTWIILPLKCKILSKKKKTRESRNVKGNDFKNHLIVSLFGTLH